ncbi:MAG: NAD(P)-dependent oxidoreductase [Myxococcota bacterium]|nr:NAD(P)-dependent oxidoreductase [Myxococcota bacterium]
MSLFGSSKSSQEPLRILSAFPQEGLSRLQDACPDIEIVNIPEKGRLPFRTRGEVLLIPPWDSGNLAKVLKRGVRWVHTIGTGVERLPLDLIGDRLLTCSRGASGIPIAEWAFAVMLAFEKDLPGSWVNEAPPSWNGGDLGSLYGQTLGIVGLGGIGQAAARLGLAFGMRVRALRRSDAPSPVEGVECVSGIGELLAESDHVLLALPLTEASHHIIDAETLSTIEPQSGLHLINVARGGLIDQEALRVALDDGRLARASLDVADPEPLPGDHWLYSHPRVRLSPHVSWSMPDAFSLLLDTFIENVGRYQRGETLEGLVDRTHGY